MFIVANLVGSTIQITTLPLPVLSTLQAVRLIFPQDSCLPTDSSAVRSSLQLHLRQPHTRRAFHTMVSRRNVSSLSRSCAYRHLRSHRRTGAQPRPALGTPRKTTVYPLDDRPSDCGGRYHHWRKNPQMDEPLDKQQSTHASFQRNGVRSRQWHTISTFPSGGKISGRAARSHDHRQT